MLNSDLLIEYYDNTIAMESANTDVITNIEGVSWRFCKMVHVNAFITVVQTRPMDYALIRFIDTNKFKNSIASQTVQIYDYTNKKYIGTASFNYDNNGYFYTNADLTPGYYLLKGTVVID